MVKKSTSDRTCVLTNMTVLNCGNILTLQVGNWSRWLTEIYGMDAVDSPREDRHANEDDDMRGPKHFLLLNHLSDLLMLPKDLLMDPSIRTEVVLITLHWCLNRLISLPLLGV